MAKMTEAVLFDLGDTLLDFDPLPRRELFSSAAHATYEHLRAKGCKLPDFEKYYNLHFRAVQWEYIIATLRGREISSFNALQKWCRKQNYPSDDASIKELIWIWYQPVIPRSHVDPEVIPTLQALQSDGLRLALVSNTLLPGCVLDRHLDMVGLKAFFPSASTAQKSATESLSRSSSRQPWTNSACPQAVALSSATWSKPTSTVPAGPA